jgi:hypothetical protein
MDGNSNHFSIFVAPIVWMSLVVLQTSLFIYWGFFAAPLDASVFFGERKDEGRRRLLSNTESLLLNWL